MITDEIIRAAYKIRDFVNFNNRLGEETIIIRLLDLTNKYTESIFDTT